MNKIIVLFGVALLAYGAVGDRALILKFGRGSAIGTSYFFPMPLNASSAIDDYGWILYDSPTSYYDNTIMYCASDDVTACVIYDTTGTITVGVQIAVDKSKFSDEVLDWTTQGYTSWSVDVNEETKEYWCMTQFFVSESFLELEEELCLEAYDDSKLLQEGTLWVTGFNGELTEIPTTTTDILDAEFTVHNCLAGMGTHYYYRMTANTTCASDTLFPWALLVDSDTLIGTVLNIVGQIAVDETRDYYEHPTAAVIAGILKVAPECLYSVAGDPGLSTMHVYYVTDPQSITCTSS